MAYAAMNCVSSWRFALRPGKDHTSWQCRLPREHRPPPNILPRLPPMFHSKYRLAILLALGVLASGPQWTAGQDRVVLEPARGLAEYRALESQIRTVVAKVLPSVVEIEVGPATGSGVIVSAGWDCHDGRPRRGSAGPSGPFPLCRWEDGERHDVGYPRPADAGLMELPPTGTRPFVDWGTRAT